MMEKKLHSFICTEDNVRIGGRTMLENDIRYMDYTLRGYFQGVGCGVHQRFGSARKAIQA